MFCTDVDKSVYEYEKSNLKNVMGFDVDPFIPEFGKGLFMYYVFCNQCKTLSSEVFNPYLVECLNEALVKIEAIKDNKKDYYQSLLAMRSIYFTNKKLAGVFFNKADVGLFYDKEMNDAVDKYWKAVLKK